MQYELMVPPFKHNGFRELNKKHQKIINENWIGIQSG